MSAKGNHRIFTGSALVGFLALPMVLLISACSTPSTERRPADAKLRYGINYLISEFEKGHPQLVSWNADAVRIQVAKPLPTGWATEAGWTIEWPGATNQEFSRVVVPWNLLGPRPKRYENVSTNYSGGIPAPKGARVQITTSAVAQIGSSKEGIDPRFAAIVHIRLSKIDPNWAIFTAVPYLPVTDIAYGWARNQNGHWQVSDFGTALVGCGTTPLSVEKEFGFACPGA